MKAHLTLTFALLLICTGAGVARALGTPDGMPPSLETVCDLETGAAYGHCNAYCEAMDCELANDGDPLTEPNASATACAKVRSKFEQATGRVLPCESPCPCAEPAAGPWFSGVLAGEIAVNACFTDALGANGILIYNPDASPVPEFPFPAFSVEVGDGEWLCGLAFPGFVLPISPAQGQNCAQLLEQAAASQGVTCGPPPV